MRCVALILVTILATGVATAVELAEETPPPEKGFIKNGDEFFGSENPQPETTDTITSLSVEQAKILVEKSYRYIDLSNLATLSPPVAKVLATFEGNLCFNTYSLTTLLPGAAKALAKHKGCLTLYGAENVSPELAAVLSQRIGPLELVFFDENAALSPRVAKSFAQYKGDFLAFDDLTTLSTEAATALAGYKGQELRFHSLTTLSAKSAKALMPFKGDLHLDGDVALTPEVAAVLSQHKGFGLHLGSKTITPAIAAALVGYKGLNLSLSRVETLDDEAAKVLSRYEGSNLCLNPECTLSETAAKELRANPNIRIPKLVDPEEVEK